MNLFTILNANNYFTVNREIAREIGLNAAIMLSEIIDKFCHFEAKGQLNEGWFYLTLENVEERTTLAKDAQAGAIKVLKDLGFIETKQMGMPAKRHFKVFKEKITEWSNSSNKKEESRKQDFGNSSNKMGEIPQTVHIEKEETKEEPYKQIPPTPKGEVCLSYGFFVKMKEEDYLKLCEAYTKPLIDTVIEELNDYMASKGIKPYKDYPATIRNWLRRRKSDPVTQSASPNKETNLTTFRAICKTVLSLNRKVTIFLRGNAVYDATGDSVDINLNPDSFATVLCGWCKLKRD